MLAMCDKESSVTPEILSNVGGYLIRALLSCHCLIAFKLLQSPADCHAEHSTYNLNAIIRMPRVAEAISLLMSPSIVSV